MTRADLALAERFDALGRLLLAVSPHLADATVDPAVVTDAQALVTRARARLGLGASGYTVVALAGATGSGKSSLFNALARLELSPAGPLRPTTNEAHACVWGGGTDAGGGAGALLDWLRVSPARRFRRESVLDADEEAALRGLVLLDLPDLDSVAFSHRVEADRLVGVVDLVIWVLDPQKYADAAVHDGYLRHMGAVRDVTVVVFNQVDRLAAADVRRCLDDLDKLVVADGLPGVAVIATSAVTGAGVEEVRRLLEATVGSWSAALARLEGELDETVATLRPLVDPPVASSFAPAGVRSTSDESVSRDAVWELAGQFARAAGVGVIAAQAGREYRARAAVPGWPLRRGDALRRAERAGLGGGEEPLVDPAAVTHAVRRFAETSAAGLPAPWPDEVGAAATSRTEELADQLAQAVRAAKPAPRGRSGWWLARAIWWLAIGAVVAGAGLLVWSVVGAAPAWPVLRAAGLRVGPPAVLIAVGVVVAAAEVPLARWLAARRARRWQSTVEQGLAGAATSVAREAVAPVRAVLRDYDQARSALARATAVGPVG